MTIYQEKLKAKCQAARDSAPCLSCGGCSRDVDQEGACDICKDSTESNIRVKIGKTVEEAIRVLRHYGFTVEEK